MVEIVAILLVAGVSVAVFVLYFVFLFSLLNLKNKVPHAAGIKYMYYSMVLLAVFSVLLGLAKQFAMLPSWFDSLAVFIETMSFLVFVIGFIKFKNWVTDNVA